MDGYFGLREAFLLGLSTAPLCLTYCGPALLPFLAAPREGTALAGGKTVGAFLLGRLLAYVAVGLALGLLGRHIMVGEAQRALQWAMLALAGFMFYYAHAITRRRDDDAAGPCPAASLTESGRAPFLAGLLMGISICPPFVVAAAGALRMGGAIAGALYFLSFFAGTSVLLAPMAFAPALARRISRDRLRTAAAAVAYIVAFCLALQALSGILPRGAAAAATAGQGPAATTSSSPLPTRAVASNH